MVAECTDCYYCVDFASGFRVFCMCPDLKGDAVCDYPPVSDVGDAYNCPHFIESFDISTFTWEELGLAERGSELLTKEKEITYAGIREWIAIYLAGQNNKPVLSLDQCCSNKNGDK